MFVCNEGTDESGGGGLMLIAAGAAVACATATVLEVTLEGLQAALWTEEGIGVAVECSESAAVPVLEGVPFAVEELLLVLLF